MKIYFSTASTDGGTKEALLESKVENLLFSYAYKSNLSDWIVLLKNLDRPNVMIDSGAFTVWTKGLKIKIQDYYDFIIEFRSKFSYLYNKLFIVNLDIIPGIFGQKPTNEEVENSAQIGFENYLWFKKKGINIIHIYHQHERIEWLEKISKLEEYIGISPANDLSTKQRIPWLNKCFNYIKSNNKTHCFGGTSTILLQKYPFYSADSASYLLCRKFNVLYGNQTVQKDVRIKDLGLVLVKKQKENIRKYQYLEKDITKLWEYRGIKWVD